MLVCYTVSINQFFAPSIRLCKCYKLSKESIDFKCSVNTEQHECLCRYELWLFYDCAFSLTNGWYSVSVIQFHLLNEAQHLYYKTFQFSTIFQFSMKIFTIFWSNVFNLSWDTLSNVMGVIPKNVCTNTFRWYVKIRFVDIQKRTQRTRLCTLAFFVNTLSANTNSTGSAALKVFYERRVERRLVVLWNLCEKVSK